MKKEKIKIYTTSARETQQIGKIIAALLEKSQKKSCALFLKGDLGAGKTTFMKGVLGYFGIAPKGASPTFVIAKQYHLKKNTSRFHTIHHIDAYRLRSKEDLKDIGFYEMKKDVGVLTCIEWPEKIKGVTFPFSVTVTFTYGKTEKEREIIIE